MKIPEEAHCSICKQVFCCGKCREKHEMKKHAIRVTRRKVDESLGYLKENGKTKKEIIYVLCPICANKPFPLNETIYVELLEHIKRQHLPLHCQKCMKVYMKIDDLREFTKCVPPPTELGIEAIIESSCDLNTLKTGIQQQTISTQTSPHLENKLSGSSSITPIAVINLQWKTKTKISQDISDSVTSFKNLSFISNSTSLRRSIGSMIQVETKGKLVRTTSTPVHSELDHIKPKEQTFNASSGQVSSIYSSGCEPENQNSPVPTNPVAGSAPNHPQQDAVTFHRKFSSRTKIAAVTPLRHVMSKSIQKAFAEHGIISFADQKAHEQTGPVSAMSDAFSSSPLDLRLSPALRRSQSDSICNSRVQHSGKKVREAKNQKLASTPSQHQSLRKHVLTGQIDNKSVTVTRTKKLLCNETFDTETIPDASNSDTAISSISTNSVYKTCQSFEIIASTDLGQMSVVENGCSTKKNDNELCPMKFSLVNGNIFSSQSSITPITRLPGSSINKKVIKFETPKVKNKSGNEKGAEEKFYTPKSSPHQNQENVADEAASKLEVVRNLSGRFSPSTKPSMRDCPQSTTYSRFEAGEDGADSNDEVFLGKVENDLSSSSKDAIEVGQKGFLQSILKSVMRLPSPKKNTKLITQRSAINSKTSLKPSIIKRCASIAGSLVRSSSLMDEKQLQSLKRKRTQTMDSQLQQHQPICRFGSVTIPDSTLYQNDLSSTKRFRIQGRKPIERMRHSSN